MRGETIHIRDPIHGTIGVSSREIKLIDHPVFQRLRNIKQLGFADLAYPGATHTRYSHSLGAMHIATRLFDRLFANVALPPRVQARFRQAVRLAMMFHDVGHAPLSHTTEMLMPPVGELGLGLFAGREVGRRASHEDYTLKMVLDSSLGALVEKLFLDDGIVPTDVAELIAGTTWQQSSGRFRHGGVDYAPALRQLVSSECDADRMDYLQRDAFYSGVSYGKFDADWLIDNVTPVQKDGAVSMGIKSRAIFSFEDFLLSRYHMFATVYLHYTPVIFENMLRKYFEEAEGEFSLPADVERYAALDDFDLWTTLRKSKNPWAQRVTRRRAYALLDERTITHKDDESLAFHEDLVGLLAEAGVNHLHSRSRSALSKYYGNESAGTIYVVDGARQAVPIESFTPLYERYERPALLTRVFVDPDQRDKARSILAALLDERRLQSEPDAPRAEA